MQFLMVDVFESLDFRVPNFEVSNFVTRIWGNLDLRMVAIADFEFWNLIVEI